MSTIPKIKTTACGNTGDEAPAFACNSLIHKNETTNPNTKEPVSPMNIFAGLKLKYKKASIPPARAKAINAVAKSPLSVMNMPSVTRLIKPMPPAKPSIPSIRLNALVTPTITSMVNRYCENKESVSIPNKPLKDMMRLPDV